ncbi:hypothetical protein [Clostridium sp. 1001283B150210_160208_E6]|uniref:hypothetical protein n=1 Tax=Clostridium sp. 1001283B150210_160208_E6 TaxID=2787129 RepID=UPI0018AB4708|nr:hypothetical protein [Clostridium sp. 1001283B150210_160208_E6]
MINNVNDAVVRMKLNSNNHSDDTFNNSIKFIVERYVGDDIPQQIEVKSIHEMIIKAYELRLKDELHSIGIIDRNKNYNGSDALNLFDTNYNSDQESQIRLLNADNKRMNSFIKYMGLEDKYKEFLQYVE